ncbi:MAG: hypothetical protein ACKOPT_11755 [Cyanobium sp.]
MTAIATISRDSLDDKVKVSLVGNSYGAECVNFGSNSLRSSDEVGHRLTRS